MGTPILKLEVTADASGLRAGMNAAATAVESSSSQMADSWRKVTAASLNYAQAQQRVRELSAQVAKATADESVSAQQYARLVESLTAAKQRAAAASQMLAEAERATKAGVESSSSAMHEARGAAALLGEETGVHLNRHLRSVLASSSILGPVLGAAFPVVAAIGLLEVVAEIPEHFQKAIDAVTGWDEAARKAFENQIAVNNIYLESLEQQKVKRAEIDALGVTGQAKIHADQAVTNAQLDAELSKRGRLASELTNLQKILASRKGADTEGAPEVNPLSESGVAFKAPPMRLDLPSQFTSDKEAQARTDELNKQIAESDVRAAQLRLAAGDRTSKLLTVQAATEARAQSEAEIGAQKAVAEAKVKEAQRSAALQLQTGKITVEQEIALQRDAVQKRLEIDLQYFEGKKRIAAQHAAADPGHRAGPEIDQLDAQEAVARINARGEQQALDAKSFTATYEAQKQAIENQIAATKRGTQEHAQLEQSLADFVRSVWGENSRQYLEIQHARIEADRQFAEAQKRNLDEATRNQDEYRRKVGELNVQRTFDDASGQIKKQEIAVQGSAQLGQISPVAELQQLAGLHQQEIALEQEKNQKLLQMQREFVEQKAVILAKQTPGSSKAVSAQKDLDQANLELQKYEDQAAQIRRKGEQTAQQDETNILKQREAAWKEFSQSISHDLTTGLNSWIEGHKTFAQSMAQMWNSIAMDAIKAIEQIAAKHIMQCGLMKAASALFHISDTTAATGSETAKTAAHAAAVAAQSATTSAANVASVLSYAGVAAAAAYASTCAIPIIGPALAPAASLASMTATLAYLPMAAFELGGVVPKTQVALVHGGERVLTPSQNNTFENLIKQGASHTYNMTTHFNVSGVGDPETVANRAANMAVARVRAIFRSGGVNRS